MMVSTVFLALACVILLGSLLVYLIPDLPIDQVRQSINKLVLYVFLPALNFQVVYASTIGHEFWQIPVLAMVGVVLCVILGIIFYLPFRQLASKTKAALLLACAFGNVTYLGIAVLQGLYPHLALETIKVVVLFEITITPLGLIIGSLVSAAYVKEKDITVMQSLREAVLAVLKMPLLWTTLLALLLNISHVALPDFILHSISLLASTVSGLMILSLGMALKYPVLRQSLRRLHILIPVVVIKLFVSPIIIYLGAKTLQVANPYFQAAVIEGAMPSQLISLIIADRFNLDTETLAIAISLDTVLSFLTIPLIHMLLNGSLVI